MLGKLLTIALAASIGLLVYEWLNPIHSRVHGVLLILSIGCLMVTAGVMLGRRWWLAAVPLVGLLAFALPGRVDPSRLGERYVAEMEQLEGARYLWGGESARGIDCSGLPRLAMRRALLAEGVGGEPWRQWARLWWQDLSAQAMGEGFGGYTVPVGVAGKLSELDLESLRPGDLAVTDSGIHVLAYMGDGEWIQADPGPGEVVRGNPATDKNGWFSSAVSVHRWTLLDQGSPVPAMPEDGGSGGVPHPSALPVRSSDHGDGRGIPAGGDRGHP